jgi:hypothetical protein
VREQELSTSSYGVSGVVADSAGLCCITEDATSIDDTTRVIYNVTIITFDEVERVVSDIKFSVTSVIICIVAVDGISVETCGIV